VLTLGSERKTVRPDRFLKWFPTRIVEGGTEDRSRVPRVTIFGCEDRENQWNLRPKYAAERCGRCSKA
jgi:hypothetical protein